MFNKKNKFKIDDVEILESVMSSHNFNVIRNNKPLSFIGVMSIFALIVVGLVILIIFAENFTNNQITILGIMGATFISFFAVFYTINKEGRDRYILAKKSAAILSQILKSVNNQISRIENGMFYPIIYPKNWLDYYESCSFYLEYDYIEYLLREFEIIDKINCCIKKDDKEELLEVIKYRRQILTDWTTDYDILITSHNLSSFSIGMNENISWRFEKSYKDFEKFFIENYSDKVKELTIEYLKKNNNACDVNLALYYVMNKIREDTELKDSSYEYEVIEDKKMLNTIFKVYLSLQEDDLFYLCWGELHLNE